GGQVFLHKVRMFRQVVTSTTKVSLIVSVMIVGLFYYSSIKCLDFTKLFEYTKAQFVNSIYDLVPYPRKHPAIIITKGGYAKEVSTHIILNSNGYRSEIAKLKSISISAIVGVVKVFIVCFLIITAFWTRFGKQSKSSKKLKGGKILSPSESNKILKRKGIASDLKLGNMHLVRNSETQHILVTGATG